MTHIRLSPDLLFVKTAAQASDAISQDIKDLARHIVSTGLLNPLTVMQAQDRYIIIDGKKRFLAIQFLARHDLLPRSLNKIPCTIVADNENRRNKAAAPALMSEQELVHNIILAAGSGLDNAAIRLKFACSDIIISQALSLRGLNHKLLAAFNSGILNMTQAAAFATVQNKQAQWDLLLALGPFVSNTEILKAITAGQTVITLSDDNIIIMPDRRCKPHTHTPRDEAA